MDQLDTAAKSTLGDATSTLSELRTQLRAALAGKERSDEFHNYSILPAADVDSLFEDSLTTLPKSLTDLSSDYSAYKAHKLTGDEFASNTYRRIEDAIHRVWRAELAQTNVNDGWYAVWADPLARQSDRHYMEFDQLQNQLYHSDLSSDQQQAQLDALKQKQTNEDYSAYEALADKFGNLMKQLQSVRATWTAATWRWADFALAMAQEKNDVSDAFQLELRRLVAMEFAAGTDRVFKDPNQDTTVEFFNDYPGSPDRLIPPISCKANEFPQLMTNGTCVLRMTHLADVSVLDLRPTPPKDTSSSATFEGAPKGYTPGEAEQATS